MATARDERVAKFHIQKGVGKARSVVTATVPADINVKEFGAIQGTLIEKIIKDLTGCACLSGAVDVIFRDEFRDVIRVDLRSGKML